nr:immunoglobulin heavy chain junction region [Macaca mulatta]MOW32688.1 immunoglobulin heavy chain junction region [Macaca mulatta]MOW33080.1 immunoglobulin heavy chain junction region [Macaca mulatta]
CSRHAGHYSGSYYLDYW